MDFGTFWRTEGQSCLQHTRWVLTSALLGMLPSHFSDLHFTLSSLLFCQLFLSYHQVWATATRILPKVYLSVRWTHHYRPPESKQQLLGGATLCVHHTATKKQLQQQGYGRVEMYFPSLHFIVGNADLYLLTVRNKTTAVILFNQANISLQKRDTKLQQVLP